MNSPPFENINGLFDKVIASYFNYHWRSCNNITGHNHNFTMYNIANCHLDVEESAARKGVVIKKDIEDFHNKFNSASKGAYYFARCSGKPASDLESYFTTVYYDFDNEHSEVTKQSALAFLKTRGFLKV